MPSNIDEVLDDNDYYEWTGDDNWNEWQDLVHENRDKYGYQESRGPGFLHSMNILPVMCIISSLVIYLYG